MTGRTLWAVIAILLLAGPGDASDRPNRDESDDLLDAILDVEKDIEDMSFDKVVNYIAGRLGLTVVYDRSLGDALMKSLPEEWVSLPKLLGTHAHDVLTMLLRQVDATFVVAEGQLRIVPHPPAAKARPDPPMSPARRRSQLITAAKLDAVTVEIERPIESATVRDILQFLADRYEVVLLCDDWLFEHERGVKEASGRQLRFSVIKGVPLRTVLTGIADQIHGTIEVRPGFVALVPEPKPRK